MTTSYESWPELLTVERPGRYLGGEIEAKPNQIPDEQGRLLKMALAFPDVYEIAHVHLGHKILYHLLNGRPGLSAERIYAPWPDWEIILRRRGHPLTSLENRRPLADFDVVGFSLQYELSYTNILAMLDLGGLPLKSMDRPEGSPLIVAGGPAAYNPEPLADFFDLFFLGDAERALLDDLEIIKTWRAEGAPRVELWARLAGRPGIYIPSLFKPTYDPEGRFAAIEPLTPGYEKVHRAVVASLEASPFPLCQITPLIKPIHDRIIIEIGRGCSRGCRFCQAGYVYRPVRERHQKTILDLTSCNLASSGQDNVSFLSLSAGDYTNINVLVSEFMNQYANQSVALSLPSLRVNSLSNHLATQIKRVRKTGFTLAPEAGTQRLRNIINKDLTNDDLMAAAERAFSLGWRTLKLYFMVGLPTETDEDLAGLANLTRSLKKLGRAQLNLGVTHFTPKAHTPFQWQPASPAEVINTRLIKVRNLTRTSGLTPKWNDPEASWVEAILARGDRRLSPVLEKVFHAGARFEAWSNHLDPNLWRLALAENNLTEEILLNPFEPGTPLPYGHIFAGPKEDFLRLELARALNGEPTPDCRWNGCQDCGACHDGAVIDLADKDATPEDNSASPPKISMPPGERPPLFPLLINFKKEKQAAFLGHLELVEIFKRAFRRAEIELAMSGGFHPQPRISFLTALPLGVPSADEYVRVETRHPISAESLTARLTKKMPPEIGLLGALLIPPDRDKIQALAATWLIKSTEPFFTPGPPLHPEAILSYNNKKGTQRTYHLANFVTAAEATAPDSALVTIKIRQAGTPKPKPTLEALWGLPAGALKGSLYKLKTILSENA
ncbi:MAG: hypothetical protein AMR96_00575 [Candidatus Adiutrix intracellularis]|nr:MAG: hypothetical protein AMR96_00575 [Candidatus Adiutrix intracellularis]